MNRISLILWLSLIATLTMPVLKVSAQQYPAVGGRQFPLNQMTPPGTYAQWAMNVGRGTPEYFQPVRVSLPTSGTVTFYEGAQHRSYDAIAPAQVSLVVGHVYRLRIHDMPEFPGIDFYPSIELVDRLHPPNCNVEDFPIEFELTLEELEWAANGRLVTKVVYLEQPDRVPPSVLDAQPRITTIEPSRNALAEADLLGRPMAIVRLGGRTPDPNQPDPTFFGPGGPIRMQQPEVLAAMKARRTNQVKRPANAGVVSVKKVKVSHKETEARSHLD
ncbi:MULTISPECIES: hypothetical protein [unclassified Schlesneria]|uniref:hypothetical protein n=1 Tax=Schlesneria TaxID=656899 RepID=UPI002EF3732F